MPIIKYIFIISIFFSGCSSTFHERGVENIQTFVSDKNRNFYLFIGKKYSFIFSNKKSIENINKIFEIHNNIKNIKISSTKISIADPNNPTLSKNLNKREYATTFISLKVIPNKNNIALLKRYNFKKDTFDKSNKGYYEKTFFMYGKYLLTDDKLRDRFKNISLSKPIKFSYINYSNSRDLSKKSSSNSLIESIKGAVALPFEVAGLGFVAIISAPAYYIQKSSR